MSRGPPRCSIFRRRYITYTSSVLDSRLEVEAPHRLEDLGAAENLGRVPEQVLEQAVLGLGEVEGPAVAGHRVGAQIHGDVVEGELVAGARRGRLPLGAAAQQRPYPREEFLGREGLHEVVVGAVVEGDDTVADGVPAGDHQDGHGEPGGSDPPRGGQSVEARHGDVHQHQVGQPVHPGDQIEGLPAVPGENGLVPLEPEQSVEPLSYGLVVIGQQDLPRHPSNV